MTDETKEPEGLDHLHIEGQVSASSGMPYCVIRAHGINGTVLAGQLDPDEIRELALGWLHAAEAADQDAAMLAVCTEILDDGTGKMMAGAVVIKLREMRGMLNDG